jgi:hypothetical protein
MVQYLLLSVITWASHGTVSPSQCIYLGISWYSIFFSVLLPGNLTVQYVLLSVITWASHGKVCSSQCNYLGISWDSIFFSV